MGARGWPWYNQVSVPKSQGKIVLIGFIGVGKTAIGRALAALIKSSFFDVDKALEAKAGSSVSEIIAQGMERFRDLESDALRELLSHPGSGIVATGGGTLTRPANRTLIKQSGRVVWLKAEPETIWKRVQGKPYVAPLFYTKQDPLMAIRVELGRRERYYQEAAEFSVAVDGKTPEKVAKEIEVLIQT